MLRLLTSAIDSFCASQCKDQENINIAPPASGTPPNGEDICVDTCSDPNYCVQNAWEWWCEQQLTMDMQPPGAACWRGCNKTCDMRIPGYCAEAGGI